MAKSNANPVTIKTGAGGGSFGNLLGTDMFSGGGEPRNKKSKRTDSSNPSLNDSFFADWDMSHLPQGVDQQRHQMVTRTFSLVRNNIVDSSNSVHLNEIDEEGEELGLLDDLGADHEDSSPEDEDDDEEILIVDKGRNIGSAFQS